ncbi:hypothetical protein QTP88_029388 [Uroleucon formosanum]
MDFEHLLSKIGPIIMKEDTNMRKAIPVQERLAITLRFLASGDSFTSLSYLFKCSNQVISNIVHEVCKALVHELRNHVKYFCLLAMEELTEYEFSSDDDEYFPEDQCPISDTEETTEQQLEQSDYEDNQSDDEEVENEVEPLEEFMLGKDKTAWARKPFYRHQTARCNVLRQRSGPHKTISTYATYNEDNPDKKQLKWNNLTSQEFRAFLGVLIMSGANNSNTDHTTEMWRPYSYPLYRASFGLGRFWNILRFIRFDNAHTRADRLKEDKAAPIADIWTMLNANLSKMYKPDECLTVDEQLYPYRGRTRFTQYMPSKPAKYGIKVWWICDSKNAYPLRGLIYTGKSKDGREINQGERVVKELAAPYKGQRRIFLRQLSEELCMPHIQERSQNCQIMRHFSTKMAIESIYRLPIKSTQTSETNVPIKQLDSTGRIKVIGCCKMCLNGETRKRRKTRKSCVSCNEPVCDEHSITIHKCGNCRQL